MESLSFAKRLARSQNKPILMVWEEATEYPLPVLIRNANGRNVVIDNLFESLELNRVIWEYFVPLKLNEQLYEDIYNDIKDTRSQSYIDKFNSDALKVMDANGNIIGTSGAFVELLNFSKFLFKYNLDLTYVKDEAFSYHTKKDFYSSFYLASKYIDYSILVNKNVRSEILKLADIYFDEALTFLNAIEDEGKKSQLQRLNLTKLKEDLIRNKPRRVLRQLKKFEDEEIDMVNKPLVSFLYYTTYRLLNEKENFEALESEISSLNLKQAQLIVNLNQ
ncbi:MAG: hypothetical protein ED556_10415 [Winogradskyella sp.]|nr:MAG: hypothetical protein ED556_10415 [Winogradskyella sp.]